MSIPCNCPCGLKLELRAIAAPGCFHSVCSHCTAACTAAARVRLEMAVAEVSGQGTRRAASAFARIGADAYEQTVTVRQVART